jgi:RNA polymerase sigma-70 factor (ECF subfamily)
MAGGLAEFSDGALVEHHLVGKPEGFEALYGRFWHRLVAYCERLTGDPALAEDVAQDAMLRAHAHLRGFDVRRPMWPWLKAIAVNVAADQVRGRTNETEWTEDADVRVGDDDPVLVERQLLARAMGRLPARQRVALGLRYVHDWSPGEAADFLGLTRPAFEQLLFRGRQRLRMEYERAARGLGDGLGVVAAPFVGLARRARLAVQRRHAAVSDALSGIWVRMDPSNAINAVICTSVACHVAVVTFAGLGALGVGSAGSPALAGPRWGFRPVSLLLATPDGVGIRTGTAGALDGTSGKTPGRESEASSSAAADEPRPPQWIPQDGEYVWGSKGVAGEGESEIKVFAYKPLDQRQDDRGRRSVVVQTPVVPVADPDGPGSLYEMVVYAGVGIPCHPGVEHVDGWCEPMFFLPDP